MQEDEAEEGDPGHQGAQWAGEGCPGREGCSGVVLTLVILAEIIARLTDCDAGSTVWRPGTASRLGLTAVIQWSVSPLSQQPKWGENIEEKIVGGVWVK